MATPPGGPYGNGYPGQTPGTGRSGRFNFPSAPSEAHRRPMPAPQQDVPARPQPAGAEEPHTPHGASHGPGSPGGGAGEWKPPEARRPVPPRRQFDHEPQPLVRPYAMTGGRTRPRYQLAIEALVSTTADPVQLQGQLPEHQRICQLCYEVKSVAEVSALLSLPLGVARILVADLAEAGLVAIHQPGHESDPGGQPDVTLLERVLSGLRKL